MSDKVPDARKTGDIIVLLYLNCFPIRLHFIFLSVSNQYLCSKLA